LNPAPDDEFQATITNGANEELAATLADPYNMNDGFSSGNSTGK
jgi:hypothetical protein